MPKTSVLSTKGKNGRNSVIVRSKFRIGSRKNGKSALSMTTKELKEVLTNKDKSKYHNKAAAVLRARGEWPGNLAG